MKLARFAVISLTTIALHHTRRISSSSSPPTLHDLSLSALHASRLHSHILNRSSTIHSNPRKKPKRSTRTQKAKMLPPLNKRDSPHSVQLFMPIVEGGTNCLEYDQSCIEQ